MWGGRWTKTRGEEEERALNLTRDHMRSLSVMRRVAVRHTLSLSVQLPAASMSAQPGFPSTSNLPADAVARATTVITCPSEPLEGPSDYLG